MGTKGGECSSSSKMMMRRKGHWSVEEDIRLMQAVNKYGEGGWTKLAKAAGLERCGKSSRLRWVNYLRPDVKRGHISNDEEMLIIKLQALYGNRWSLIAAHLPGRSDNEIKNYWRSHIKNKKQHKQHKQQRHTIMDEVETGVQTQGLTSFEEKEEEEEETMVKVVTCGDPNDMYVMEPNVNIDIQQGLVKEVATSCYCINHEGNLSSTYYDDFDMISLLRYQDGLHNTSSNCYPLLVTCPNGDGCWVEIEAISNAYNIPQSVEALPDFQTSSHNVSLWPHNDQLFFNHTHQTIE